jgi:hypothetical protein
MTETEIMKLGRQLERLHGHEDFQDAILGAFMTDLRKELTTGFDGAQDAIDGLKAIAYFEDWIEQSVEYARQIQQEQRINDGE